KRYVPTGGSSEEYCAMGATLTQRRRVDDEGLRVVKSCQMGRSAWWLIPIMFDGTIRGSTG
ncbi:hypothetical protein DV030_16905, partial [Lacticaseibacillus paracasei]|nr:hypothetical protein [Lacticaseibacillus paracasei]